MRKNILIAFLVIAVLSMLFDNIEKEGAVYVYNGPWEEFPTDCALTVDIVSNDTIYLTEN